ncbi:hypothetical protein GX411_06675 [Candidatus Fermentibacteria bacterium]|nr:hypothetical protein [Candidatus Fermentibacteria bacterium]
MSAGVSGRPPRVLFLCTGNSARSIMAEAVSHMLGRGLFEDFSAGTRPTGVNPMTIRVLEEAGFETSGLRSKSVDDLSGMEFDVIVTLCDSARQECPFIPGRAERRHWDIPDPAAAPGDEASRLRVFRDVLEEVKGRVSDLAGFMKAGDRAEPAASDLRTDGYEGAKRNVVAFLSPREVRDVAGRRKTVILDIRPGHETSYRQFDLPEATIVQTEDPANAIDSLPRDSLVVVADSVGLKSRAAAVLLAEAGFDSVAVMVGGMVDWERDGLPVKKDPDFELRGQCGCKLRARGKRRS